MSALPWIFKRRSYELQESDPLGMIRMLVYVEEGMVVYPVVHAQTYFIDWGDGCSDGERSHCYEQAGHYRIRIVGMAIHAVDVSKCSVYELYTEECPGIRHLNCAHNQLSRLDVSRNFCLVTLDCSDNWLTELEIRKADELIWLDCSDNKLNQLVWQSCKKLLYLYCSGNKLHRIVPENSKYLHCIDIGYNQMSGEDLNRFFGRLPYTHNAAILIEQDLPDEKNCQLDMLRQKEWHIL